MADAQAPSPKRWPLTPESLRLELQEAITTFRHQWSQLLQALGIIIAADSALLSYGFARKLSGVLLVASLMPLVALSAYITIMTALVPICYVAIRLEQQLSIQCAPFVETWVAPRGDLPTAIRDFAQDLASLTNSKEQKSALKVSAGPFLRNLTSLAIYAAFALQLALAVISIVVFHFRFL
jgi:hypothetical protein